MALKKLSESGRFRLVSNHLFEEISAASNPVNKARSDTDKLAILVCKDATSRKWGPKWLEQAGFTAVIATTQADLQMAEGSMQPALLLVESGLRAREGQPLHQWLAESGLKSVPRLVLCASDRDIELALASGATDVVRKPFNWQVISRRASRMVHSFSSLAELDKAQTALERALNFANDARQLLQRVEEVDLVTELPNRNKFAETIDRVLGAIQGRQNCLAVMLIGINRFSAVNDSFGHEGGNEILAQVGERLQGCMSREDLFGHAGNELMTAAAAKLGGVRFGLMLSHGGNDGQLQRVAESVQKELERPVQYDGQAVHLSCSFGIAVAMRDGDNADQLILNAESALLSVKRAGGGINIYSEQNDRSAARRRELEQKLRLAIENQDLELHYQPLISNTSLKLFGVEALLRWHCPEEGQISPGEFVPVAEDAGLMNEIGSFVIREACQQLRIWRESGISDVRMAVNVSVAQLTRGNIVGTVREALMSNNVDPSLLELELSERGVVKRDEEIMRKLQQLRALGVRISIDDFGSGEASIAYLKHLPIDTLKIDRSYVSGCADNERDQVMGMVMSTLGQKLGLSVIAEGVETAEQLQKIKSWGCDASQGFYFSPAVPSEHIEEMLRKIS